MIEKGRLNGRLFCWFLRQTYKVFEDLIGLIVNNCLNINHLKQGD